jgi:NAD(P)H-dependent flavin oxidoreductase YrpB (nitropropane dioxygenase family)
VNRGLAAAAAIVISFTLGTAIASHEAAAADRQAAHTCAAVDRDFLRVASAQMLSFRMWSADYVTGAEEPTRQAAMADEAAQLVMRKHALDPSLERARLLMGSMLIEYERAVLATSAVDAGASLHRVRDLGIALRSLLSDVGPGLAAVGCDVAPLL